MARSPTISMHLSNFEAIPLVDVTAFKKAAKEEAQQGVNRL
jgi:hypothetical protein